MVFSKLASLSVRPPTPPKDVKEHEDIDDTLAFMQDPFGINPRPTANISSTSLLNTPDRSPSSETGNSLSSTVRKKRVSFQLQTCSTPNKLLPTRQFTPIRSSPLRPLAQTRVSGPLKSILKASDPTSTPPPTDDSAAPAHKFQSFPEMLESVVKALAQGARPSKLDAYLSLVRTLQAYEKVPDIEALINKIGLLSQFIHRDIQAVSISGTGLDSPLIIQALKLLLALVRIPELRPAMDDDFCIFLIERVIKVASDAAMPKVLVNTHLALLMQQNFKPRILTVARVERILELLDTIHERVTGYSVQAYRIRIYKKLIQQHPQIMAAHTEAWFKHPLKAMLSGHKDINSSALDTIMIAAKTIGTERVVTKAVLSILNRVKNDSNTLGGLYAQELERALDSDAAPQVPQIWSAITAFLQGSLHESAFFAAREWLRVFEKFSSSQNESVRLHANVSYNFLVYAIDLSETTAAHKSKMLQDISHHQLLHKRHSKKSELDTATLAHLTLLYYALPPQASYAQLDRYWTELVVGIWSPLVDASAPKHSLAACRIATALFNGSRKPWNEKRALELKPQLLIQREELPMLDPKWLRKSLSIVLPFVETLLDAVPWAAITVDDEPLTTMWVALLDSLVEAGSKEIMASSETKDSLAHIVNLLRRMWNTHTAKLAEPQEKEDSWANKFCFLVKTVIQKLGAFQFTDKCLTRNSQDDFGVASTPSHRSRNQGPRISPLLYFVDLLVNKSEEKLSDAVRLRALQLILEPCLSVQSTRMSKLELLKDCSAAADTSPSNAVAVKLRTQVWSLTKLCIEDQFSASNEHQSQQLGKEYEQVVAIMALGSPHLLATQLGPQLLTAYSNTVRDEAGEGAVVIVVIEKVSETILSKVNQEDTLACLPYLNILLANLPKTVARRTLEQGRQQLYPGSPAQGRVQEFDPYNHLYGAIVTIGSAAYYNLESSNIEQVQAFLTALAISIRQCAMSLLAVYLRKIQGCITLWIEDSYRMLQNKDETVKQLQRQVVDLWQAVQAAVISLPRKDSSILVTLEPLITAGFVSRRRRIVNISVETWNATFGKEESLRYPTRIEKALQRLRNTAELSLPSLPIDTKYTKEIPSFYESDSSGLETPVKKPSTRNKQSPFRINKATRKSQSPASSAISRKTSAKRTPKSRLRHEDSQIQFEPIVSSPTDPFLQESQVLTARQKEMIERHKMSGGLYATLGSDNSSIRPSPQVLQELHSDAGDAEDLPVKPYRTPTKLAAMGPMDVFLGSSPTPQARNRSQQILNDKIDIATPSAVRTMQAVDGSEELGSSPPRFQNDLGFSFNDDTTMDEELLVIESDSGFDGLQRLGNDLTEADPADVPSSTVESQLNAQLNAEVEASVDSSMLDESTTLMELPQESNNIYVDAPSQRLTSDAAELPAEIQAEPIDPIVKLETDMGGNFSQSTSNDAVVEESTPQMRGSRRSSRLSTAPTPTKQSGKKKRGRPSKKDTPNRESAANVPMSSALPLEPAQDDDASDCIVVASPAHEDVSVPPAKTTSMKGKGKRTWSKSQTPDQNILVPETTRREPIRPSRSLRSQANPQSEDVVVEDTPAPKRLRQSAAQDVSDAKSPHSSQVKRLSHVQVTPRHTKSCSSSVRTSFGAPEDAEVALEEAVIQQNGTTAFDNKQIAKSALGPRTPTPFDPEQSQSQDAATAARTSTRSSQSIAERIIATPSSIIKRLCRAAMDMKHMIIGRDELQALDEAMFKLKTEMFAAEARGRQAEDHAKQ